MWVNGSVTFKYYCVFQHELCSAFSCESKIRAIETKLKLLESGGEHNITSHGKHPLLVQSEHARSHPYKKQERYSAGRGKYRR